METNSDNRKNFIRELDKLIGKRVSTLRESKGISRRELSRYIGVTYQQLRKYEEGVNRISVGKLFLISRALSKNISHFYDGIEKLEKQELDLFIIRSPSI